MTSEIDEWTERELLIEALPERPAAVLREQPPDGLLEVVLDLGRPPTARYSDRELVLDEGEVTEQDIEHVVATVSEFGDDNRAGIPRTLHRISAIRNRRGRIVGLTCRVGRSKHPESSTHRMLLTAPGVE